MYRILTAIVAALTILILLAPAGVGTAYAEQCFGHGPNCRVFTRCAGPSCSSRMHGPIVLQAVRKSHRVLENPSQIRVTPNGPDPVADNPHRSPFRQGNFSRIPVNPNGPTPISVNTTQDTSPRNSPQQSGPSQIILQQAGPSRTIPQQGGQSQTVPQQGSSSQTTSQQQSVPINQRNLPQIKVQQGNAQQGNLLPGPAPLAVCVIPNVGLCATGQQLGAYCQCVDQLGHTFVGTVQQ